MEVVKTMRLHSGGTGTICHLSEKRDQDPRSVRLHYVTADSAKKNVAQGRSQVRNSMGANELVGATSF